MAKIRIHKSIENLVYKVLIENDVSALSEGDRKLMQQFGEPEINLGGTFLEDTANEFELPDEYVRVRSDLPVLRSFDAKDGEFADSTVTKVDGYVAEIISRFNTAFTELRTNNDVFTAEIVENI